MLLRAAIIQSGEAVLVVSGGSTPLPFFKQLSKADIEWKSVTILLADERWVSPEHKQSNERLVCESLLQYAAKDAQFISLAPQDRESLHEGALRLNKMLKGMRPDVTILGMGEDGHTASLFPHHTSMKEGMQSDANLIAVSDSPKPPSERVSLTANMLKCSKHLFMHITGNAKLDTLNQENPEYPITQILATSKTQPIVFWAE